MNIRTSVVYTEVMAEAARELEAAAKNQFLSRREQTKLAPELAEAADAARAAKGNGARIIPGDVWTQFEQRVRDSMGAVNQSSGSGAAYLSRREATKLLDVDPPVGARVQKAIDILRER